MAAAIGAIGVNLLTGSTGQLSMGHAFFLAVGEYRSRILGARAVPRTGTPSPASACPPGSRLSWPCSWPAAGRALQPHRGAAEGADLGIATLALIFIGQHALFNAGSLTGGFNGRPVLPLPSSGSPSTTPRWSSPQCPSSRPRSSGTWGWPPCWRAGSSPAGAARQARPGAQRHPGPPDRGRRDGGAGRPVPGGRLRPVLDVRGPRGRPARAGLPADRARVLRHDPVPRIPRHDRHRRAGASVAGAVIGAAFVSLLPQVLTHYSDSLPLVSAPGTGGIAPGEASRYLYGAAVVAVVLFLPGGIRSRRLKRFIQGKKEDDDSTCCRSPRCGGSHLPSPSRDAARRRSRLTTAPLTRTV